MKKVSLLLVMILLLVTVSVDAQKKKGKIQPPTPMGSYSIQDEEGEGYIVFDANTGAFLCVFCEEGGYAIKGVGTVKFEGLSVLFNCTTEDYKMFVKLNVYEAKGKAVIELYRDPQTGDQTEVYVEKFVDLNTNNNTLACNSFGTR